MNCHQSSLYYCLDFTPHPCPSFDCEMSSRSSPCDQELRWSHHRWRAQSHHSSVPSPPGPGFGVAAGGWCEGSREESCRGRRDGVTRKPSVCILEHGRAGGTHRPGSDLPSPRLPAAQLPSAACSAQAEPDTHTHTPHLTPLGEGRGAGAEILPERERK